MSSHGAPARIAVVSAYLDPLRRNPEELVSGVWRDFGRVPGAAKRAGVDVTVLESAWKNAELEVEGVRCHFVCEPRDPFVSLPGGRKLRRAPHELLARVQSHQPDIIHYKGLILPAQARRLAHALPGVPILAQDHGTKCPTGWRARWYGWGFAPLTGVMFTARAQALPFMAARALRRDLPVFEVVEGSSPFIPGDVAAARNATGLRGDPCLLWVGNLDANKDPLLVLNAVSQFAEHSPGVRLYMCFRHGPLLANVRQRIATDPRLSNRVVLLGEIRYPVIQAHFQAADFLVQASHAEGSGYGVIEALACGTTPIVTDIPSFRRITGDGRRGALVPLDDVDAFAAALRDWCGRDRAALRQQARAHFERELSFDAIGRQLRSVYDHVAGT